MSTPLDLIHPFVLFQCVNLIVPSLIQSWKYTKGHFSAYIPSDLLSSASIVYAYEDPTANFLLFIEKTEGDVEAGDQAIYRIYCVHPDVYTEWKTQTPGSVYKYHARYTHHVYRIIEEQRQHMWKEFQMCWNDMTEICKDVLKVDLAEMAFAFEEANIFALSLGDVEPA